MSGPSMDILNNSLVIYHLDKENFPENIIIYISQGYLTIKDNKWMFYADYFLIDVRNYVFKGREVKFYRPRYDPQLG